MINLFTRDVVIVESVPFSLRADGVELMDVLVSVMPLLRSIVSAGEEVTGAGEESVQVGKIQTNLNNECYKMAVIVQTGNKQISEGIHQFDVGNAIGTSTAQQLNTI